MELNKENINNYLLIKDLKRIDHKDTEKVLALKKLILNHCNIDLLQCNSCSTTLSNYFFKIKEQFNKRIEQGLDLNKYIEATPYENDLTNINQYKPEEEIVNNVIETYDEVEQRYEDDIIEKYIPKKKTTKKKK